MKKTGKILTLVLAFALCIGLTAAITTALLTDETESAHNVMVSGNVYIEQYEYERVLDENGLPTTELQPFTQNKPWIPVTEDIGWDQDGYQTWEQVGAPGSNELFEKAAGVQDKFVFVKNTGSTSAYYRTIVAVESPEGTDALVHINQNSNQRFDASNAFYATINGIRYYVTEYLYLEELEPGEVSRPSFLQVYLDKAATNEDVNKFGGQLDILVMSQGVQSSGFDSAKEALDAAFNPVDATLAAQVFSDTAPAVIHWNPSTSGMYEQLQTLKAGDVVILSEGTYTVSGSMIVPDGVTIQGAEGETVVFHQSSSGQDNVFNCEGDATFRNITIETNRKGYAIADNTKNHDTDGNILVENCKFVGIATEKNWGIYKNLNGNLTVTNCTFENYDNALCGINNGNGSVTTITGCTFTNINGEAIGYVIASMPADFETTVIARNTGLTAENVIGY